jgi:hypothetical protein
VSRHEAPERPGILREKYDPPQLARRNAQSNATASNRDDIDDLCSHHNNSPTIPHTTPIDAPSQACRNSCFLISFFLTIYCRVPFSLPSPPPFRRTALHITALDLWIKHLPPEFLGISVVALLPYYSSSPNCGHHEQYGYEHGRCENARAAPDTPIPTRAYHHPHLG